MTVNTSISFTPGEFYFEWYDVNVVAFNVSINTKELAEKESVTEKIKDENQMEWVQKMNNIRNRATEIVNNEVIYV